MKTSLTCTKEVSWEMAHRLSFHHGLCKNLHGHTYKLQATFKSESGKMQNGMIADFSSIKGVLQRAVVDKLDHACWLNGKTDDTHIGTALKDLGLKFLYTGFEPTAENMVAQIAAWIEDDIKDSDTILVELRLYETPTSWVTWRKIC